jgi:protease I
MAGTLEGMRVAILATDGFEQVELTSPRNALRRHGADVDVIAPRGGRIRAWKHGDWGEQIVVDYALGDADPNDYDALLLPGGSMNPDQLRQNEVALAFVRSFFRTNKPVAAICHAPWTLIDADVVEGRRLTSYPSLQKDLMNAGARWVDREVVIDGNLVTSRRPDDLYAFEDAFIGMMQSPPKRYEETRA